MNLMAIFVSIHSLEYAFKVVFKMLLSPEHKDAVFCGRALEQNNPSLWKGQGIPFEGSTLITYSPYKDANF